MNNKVTFPRLASLLADKSGQSKRFSEDFLRELFSLISEELENGDSVKVKGIGTFRLIRVEPRKSVDVTTGQPMEISGHSKVAFTPAKELAEAVNAPFEAFSAIEIDDDFDLASISEGDDIIVQDDSQEIVLSSAVDLSISDQTILKDTENYESYTEPHQKEQEIPQSTYRVKEDDRTDDKPEEPLRRGPKVETSKTSSYDEDDIIVMDDGPSRGMYDRNAFDRGKYGFGIEKENKVNWPKTLLICSVCAFMGMIVTFIVWSLLTKPNLSHDEDEMYASEEIVEINTTGEITVDKDEPQQISEIETGEDDATKGVENIDNEEDVPTSPSDAIVYDTIGKSRYLTTMAHDHYGNNKFWPYIYEENKDRIGHPDKIRPGTPIVIPKLSKYGVNPSNPQDAEKANKLGVEIYARYGKSL